MVGRRRRGKGSGRLKHLKTQRGLTLPFGSGGDDDENDVFFGFSEKFRNQRVERSTDHHIDINQKLVLCHAMYYVIQ